MKLILLMFVATILLPDVKGGRSLVFPEQTSTSFAELTPAKPLSLNAFTLCLRFATELFNERRDVILFTYITPDADELHLWRLNDGRLKLVLNGPQGAYFEVPELGPLENHVCVAWESVTGKTTMYLNGRSAASQIFQKGYTVQPGGRLILGQDADSFLGDFDATQSFVGEIFEVNMWDRVLPPDAIQQLSTGKCFSYANVIDWATVKLTLHGKAVELQES
ncbi:C-reactive protein-like [Gadus chalcogrammus]|uniref:C-reactive protein-like n=1 Tax=Gadus chalcogrammus TaxID=1042646 RepID=UPI0024C4C5F9|nr:C-reactive protein-like [Gadus chalcogrammus]